MRRLALGLDGTVEAPHMGRAAFKVARIYATLAPGELTANLRLTPDEQEFKCMLNPAAFAPVPNAWGRQGWTIVTLAVIELDELATALTLAWTHVLPKSRVGKRRG